ncbi:hypothetical protein Poli38472_004122 [Pythium oligandrum]|uniref:Uncharacterized protein n=1 Tax=Pythium oligandrum TaxID=41045 RepID=A0A8K1CPP6_PYTOL|nr:hypothetical protein Poli38472_004122 [Pythium oligandrum]|eukprot:TMW66357.1 hypothetical protein Poli38472_004122 [Pythium oligandrum]
MGDNSATVPVLESRPSTQSQTRERIVLQVKDFALVGRLLNVRVYQICYGSSDATSPRSPRGTYSGFRVAATDEVENDYALFVSRTKAELLHHVGFPEYNGPPSAESLANCILTHLDISGNRHRDVGRLVCKDPAVQSNKRERVVPPKTPSKLRNKHLQGHQRDKRAVRTMRSVEKTQEAIAAALKLLPSAEGQAEAEAKDGTYKLRKGSEASILHRMAVSNERTMWKSELEGIRDEISEYMEMDEGPGVYRKATVKPDAKPSNKRALPERKAKHKGLQERRDKGRNHRHLAAKGSTPTNSDRSITTVEDPPPQTAAPAVSGMASVVLGVMAVRAFRSLGPPEQEQFLRRRTISAKRVFKEERVFDGIVDVEITNERPDRRPSYEADTPAIIANQKKLIEQTSRRSSLVRDAEGNLSRRPSSKNSQRRLSISQAALDASMEGEPTLATSTSEPVLALTSRDDSFEVKATPRPEEAVENARPRSAPVGEARTADSELIDSEHDSYEAEQTIIASEHAAWEEKEATLGDPTSITTEVAEEVSSSREEVGIESLRSARRKTSQTVTIELDLQEDPSTSMASTENETEEVAQEIISNEEKRDEGVSDDPVVIQEAEAEQSEETSAVSNSQIMTQETEAEQSEETAVAESSTTDSSDVRSARLECWEASTVEEEAMLPSPEILIPEPSIDQEKVVHDDDTDEQAGGVEEQVDSIAVHEERISAHDDVTSEEDHIEHKEFPVQEKADAKVEALDENLPIAPVNEESEATEPPVEQIADQSAESENVIVAEDMPESLARSEVGEANKSVDPPPSQEQDSAASSPPSRRSSFLDLHTSVIITAAAAAAAQPESITTTKGGSSIKRSGSVKRRSHDGTVERANVEVDRHRESRRKSTGVSVSSDGQVSMTKPDSSPRNTTYVVEQVEADDTTSKDVSTNPLEVVGSSEPPKETKPNPTDHNQRTQRTDSYSQPSVGYHSKWRKWVQNRKVIDKVTCFQLEEMVLQDPRNECNVIKLGIRYARSSSTSLAAVILLEHASFTATEEGLEQTHEYWNALGGAHFDLFLRQRKFLPAARFHLVKCVNAFSHAFAFIESLADPLLLLRYTICLFWRKKDNHLEKAHEILTELFAKFASFCEKDRVNLLILHFQVLWRLKRHLDAVDTLRVLIILHGTASEPKADATEDKTSPPPYERADYLLMVVHCQQARGDFLQASATFTTMLRAKGIAQEETVTDAIYLQVWQDLANKCFDHEDYTLALEYFTVALTFAKNSQVLAHMHYMCGLCCQALGEDQRCITEFKRARTINRHVTPLATLGELHVRYEDYFLSLVQHPVTQTVGEVRENVYDTAVTSLQRLFRHKKKKNKRVSDKEEGRVTRKTSNVSTRKSSSMLDIEKIRESMGSIVASTDHTGVEESDLPVESFTARRSKAIEQLQRLRDDCKPPSSSSAASVLPKATSQASLVSGLLSPEKSRLEVRRQHSIASFNRLGYVPSTLDYVEYWDQLLHTALDLFESRAVFSRAIGRVRAVLPLVSEPVAFCALAESIGSAEEAIEKLHGSTYERELTYVTQVVDVAEIIQRHFSADSTTRFPPLKSTTVEPTSISSIISPSQRVTLPRCGNTSPRIPKKSPDKRQDSTTSPPEPWRVGELIDAHLSQHRPPRKDSGLDELSVMRDFRQVNTSALHASKMFK